MDSIEDIDELSDLSKGEKQKLFKRFREWLDSSEKEPLKPDPEDNDNAISYRKTDRRYSPEAQEQRDLYAKWLRSGERGMEEAEYRKLALAPGTWGGILVPTEVSKEIIRELDDITFVRQMAQIITVDTAETIRLPRVNQKMSEPTWVQELSSGGEDTDLSLEGLELTPKPLAHYIRISRDLLGLASDQVISLVEAEFKSRYAAILEREYMRGDGTHVMGIFTESGNGISSSRDVTAAKTTTIGYDDLADTLL
jgi:HK97 family phage major capsid protein